MDLDTFPERDDALEEEIANHTMSGSDACGTADNATEPSTAPNDSAEPDDGLRMFQRSNLFEHFCEMRQHSEKQKRAGKRRLDHRSNLSDDIDETTQQSKSKSSTRKRVKVPKASRHSRIESPATPKSSAYQATGDSKPSSKSIAQFQISQTEPIAPKTPNSLKSTGPSARETRTPSGKMVLELDNDSDNSESLAEVIEKPARTPVPKANDTIILAESDESSATTPAKSQPELPAVKSEVEEELPTADATPKEDEFQAYIDRAAAQRLEAQNQAQSQDLADLGAAGLKTRDSQGTQKPSVPASAVVEVLVTSSIEGAIPFRANIRLTQALRVIRNSWSVYQQHKGGVDVERAPNDTIIITWRRKRLYDWTTLHSLGVRIVEDRDGNGDKGASSTTATSRLYVADGRFEGLSKARSRVVMEAWTSQMYDEFVQNQERMRRHALGEESDEGSSTGREPDIMPDCDGEDSRRQEVGSAHTASEMREGRIRLRLQARDKEPVRAGVSPFLTMETLVNYYRREGKVGPDKEVWLTFDGERLEEHVTVEEAGVEDGDVIEVYVR